ncbi:MAG TPA: acyl-protein synthetase [Gemmatimonadota bacterium]
MDRERLRRAEAATLDARVLAAVHRGWARPLDEREVDALAAALFEHQARHAPALRRWWAGAGVRRGVVRRWTDVPPVPVALFRRARVAAFPRSAGATPRFVSSGTTGASRSRVYLEDLALYRAAAVAGFARHALADRERMRLLFLAPSARAAPQSSLSRMFEFLRGACGAPGSAFLWRSGRVDVRALGAALGRARAEREPVFLLAPAFALVHALDALTARGAAVPLPAGSRLFVTGGFKGRSREVEPDALARACLDALGIGPGRIVHEYGMAELSSQFYAGPDRLYEAPPWVRWRVLDPSTLAPLPPGAPGVLAVWDLANRSGCLALRTEDLAVSRGARFELLGRAPRAEPRGCSLEAEAALA